MSIANELSSDVAAAVLAATAMLVSAAGFFWMSTWGADALEHASATVPLVLGGLGFGAAIAPVNAALLASTDAAVHGVSSALLVVARMVGMLIGVSALTTVGLRRYYAVADRIPPLSEVCQDTVGTCPAYNDQLLGAGLAQLEAVFVGAGACAVVAAALALGTLRGADTRGTAPTATVLRGFG